jgi:hypothetical protein
VPRIYDSSVLAFDSFERVVVKSPIHLQSSE